MSYVKHTWDNQTWSKGQKVLQDQLNEMETGIEEGVGTPIWNKLLVFGDSVSSGELNEGRSYADILKNAKVVKDFKNYAVAGTALSVNSEHGYPPALYMQISNHSSELASADLIIIGIGGNDAYALHDGYVASAADVADRLSDVFTLVYSNNPTATVLYLNSCPYDKSHMTSFIAEVSTIYPVLVDMAKKYGTINMDEFNCGYNDATKATITHDGVHFNDIGYKQIAAMICSTLGVDASNVRKLTA